MKIAAPFAALLAPMCLVLWSCGNGEDPDLEAEFVGSLRAVLRDHGEVSRFDLNTATTFDWDVVHVFRPYTDPSAIRIAVGSGIDDRRIDWRDDINLFVFTNNGDVAMIVEVPRGICDVSPSATTSGPQSFRVAAREALFEILVDEAGYCRMVPTRTMHTRRASVRL